jgi:hypothetical protein
MSFRDNRLLKLVEQEPHAQGGRRELLEDLDRVFAKHPEGQLQCSCAVCDKELQAWDSIFWIDRVDIYGESLVSGYVCSVTCLRKATAIIRQILGKKKLLHVS